ncbi:hypothetical protein U8527_07005 [Kordia algicida OT-1]|uniref:Uncharacterized protein n=1 Tax=Kordia algicida OT-1 TaxID=391587 RepID=A9E9N5_9FLAO|nr:hypothetical protein [Kordia algicida]EDP94689.1 hypothetical protein KAOT1_00395 [Kordia algicida OT-1]
MQIKKTDEKFIDLKKLSEILLMRGIRSAKNWCETVGIKIQIVGNKSVVHRFLVDMELDKSLIVQLKKKYPKKWEELYRCYIDNDRLGYLMLLEDNPELNIRKISNTITPMSDTAKSFANS